MVMDHFNMVMYHLNTPTALLERSDVPINRAVTGHLEGIQTFKKSQGIQLRFKSSENNPTPGNPIDDWSAYTLPGSLINPSINFWQTFLGSLFLFFWWQKYHTFQVRIRRLNFRWHSNENFCLVANKITANWFICKWDNCQLVNHEVDCFGDNIANVINWWTLYHEDDTIRPPPNVDQWDKGQLVNHEDDTT